MTIGNELGRYVGQSLRRREDRRLLLGESRYVGDLSPEFPGLLHVALLRSPYPAARIRSIESSAAAAAPGVARVLTGTDLTGLAPMPPPNLPDAPPAPAQLVLATDQVRFVGDPLAAVLADTPQLARDALDLLEVDYEPLPAVVEAEAALREGAPRVHDSHPDNVLFRRRHQAGDAEAAFAAADHVVRLRLGHGRVASVAMEPRGVLAQWDRQAERLTLWSSTQAPFGVRNDLVQVIGLPQEQIRVIAPDVGGGFGAKGMLNREEALAAYLARELDRPVTWLSTRSEDMASTIHGRDMVSEVEVAAAADGRLLAMRVRTIINLGAYAFWQTPIPTMRLLNFPTGCYTIEHLEAEIVGVLTNTTPTGPYRGAGRPEATFVAERAIDAVATALGQDPVEIRRRNFIPATAFPYVTAGGISYDSGDYERTMDHALDQFDYARLRREQAERRSRGELVGIGLATYTEVAGGMWEGGHVALEEDGTVTAVTGSSAHGQGHVTTFAQILADELGVEPTAVQVRGGDTEAPMAGIGTFGSRSIVLGGSALVQAAGIVRERALRVAAALLETSPEDLELRDGQARVRGLAERAVSFAELSRAAKEGVGLGPEEPRLLAESNRFQTEGGDTFPFGTAIALVAVERETGRIKLERLLMVDDCGRAINPLLVDGQLAGGAVQGIGEALLEQVHYTPDGQLATASLLDYAAPRALDVPWLELDRTETPSPRTPLGVKGVGEAGTVGAPAAIANAVVDALSPFGLQDVDLPLTHERVWRLMT